MSQISGMLDELVSELRVANGQPRFELNLVATVGPPPAVPLLPTPTFRESVQQALAAAKHAEDSAERMTLLESIASSLEAPGATRGMANRARASRRRSRSNGTSTRVTARSAAFSRARG